MKLTDLSPRFLGSGGPGVRQQNPATGLMEPEPRREGVALQCDCPCGCKRPLVVPFANALDGQPGPHGERGWARTGDTFATLTLSPSILRTDTDGCRWHGWIVGGEVRSC